SPTDTPYSPIQFSNAPGPTVQAGGLTGNFLRLATTTVPNHNAVAFDLTDPGQRSRVVIDFDFRITPPAGQSPADGIGFALLNKAFYGATGATAPPNVVEEPNFQQSFGLGIDTHQNAAFGDLPGGSLSVHWAGQVVAQFDASALGLASGNW